MIAIIADMVAFACVVFFTFMRLAVGPVAEKTKGCITLLDSGFTLIHAAANMTVWLGRNSGQCWSKSHGQNDVK